MKKGSFILIIAVIILLFVGIYSAYLFWQRSELGNEVKTVENLIKNSQEELLQRDNAKLIRAIASKESANEIKSSLIKWSQVIKDIRLTVPEKEGFPVIEVLSYSGGANKEISLNIKTLPNSEKAYFDVADLIRAFDNSNGLFVDTFVGSISGGVDEKGKEILSFLLTTKYVGRLEESLMDVLDDSLSDSLNEEEKSTSVAR